MTRCPVEHGSRQRTTIGRACIEIDVVASMQWRFHGRMPMYDERAMVAGIVGKFISDPDEIFLCLLRQRNARAHTSVAKEQRSRMDCYLAVLQKSYMTMWYRRLCFAVYIEQTPALCDIHIV